MKTSATADLKNLDEDLISGSTAFVFHRTAKWVVDSIIAKGWQPGSGAMYGVGLYTCWDLKDQLDGKMKRYGWNHGDGGYIVKFRVNFKDRFLHFHYPTAKTFLGRKYSIVDQLVALKVYPSSEQVPEFWVKIHEYLETASSLESANIAYTAFFEGCNNASWGYFNQFAVGTGIDFKQNSVAGLRNVIQKWKIRGITYEGHNDHKVFLAYDYMSAVPVAYAVDDTCLEIPDAERLGTGMKLLPLPSTGKIWNNLVNARDIVTARNSTELLWSKEYPQGALNKLLTDWGMSKEPSLVRLKKMFPWTINPLAHFKDAVLSVQNGELSMLKGTWLSGVFQGVEFGSEAGYSQAGQVDNDALFVANKIRMRDKMCPFWGVMSSGLFERGRFNGCFRGGTVILDNTLWDDSKADLTGKRSSLGTVAPKRVSYKGNTVMVIAGIATLEEFINLPENQGKFSGLDFIDVNGRAKFVEADGSIKEKLLTEEILDEDYFKLTQLTPAEQDELFATFTKSYIDATGASFDRNDFQWRAENWEFYGSKDGGVSVRRQNTGGLKLTSCFGDVHEITKGFRELIAQNPGKIIWGVMPEKLCISLEFLTRSTKDFKRLPGVLVKIVFPYLAKALGIQGQHNVGLDGGIMIPTPAGPMKKFMISNSVHRAWMADNITNGDTSKLPVPQPVINMLKGMVNLLL